MEEKSSTNMSNGQQQFNLRWNNHTSNILQVFTEQFASEALVDVTLSCEGQFIKAHKMILSACSPYFQDLFRVHNVQHPVIIINGMKYTDVRQVVDFMYRGEVKVLEAELDSLLAVAESLQVKGLSTVRNNYEKSEGGQAAGADPVHHTSAETTCGGEPSNKPKKRKISNDGETFTKAEVLSDDESLSSTIKIEPPEIKDIDQEDEKTSEPEELVYEPKAPPPPPSKPAVKTSKSGRPIRQKTYSNADTYTSSTGAAARPPKYQPAAVLEPIKACKIPRPPNAFMIFANEWRRKLASEHPKESNKEISVRLGVMWKNLSSDAKETYYSASRKADEEHKRKYPGYYYSPKEARLRKNLKESLAPAKKKHCDAMRFVKLVMKENSDGDRWRTPDQQPDDDGYLEEDTLAEDVTVNTSDETDNEDKLDALKIDTSPDENEADSSTSKD